MSADGALTRAFKHDKKRFKAPFPQFYMSVVVIDGNMPTDYDSCWYLDCKRWKECYINGKPDNCPLRPLPEKHGRLGDLDEIMNKLIKDKREAFTKHYVWLMLSHYGAETIVEPEGK